MIISEKQIMALIHHLSSFIDVLASINKEKTALFENACDLYDQLHKQQSEELKVIE